MYKLLSILSIAVCFAQTVKAQIAYESLHDQSSFNTKPFNTNLEVGATPGAASVSLTGAATYTIPIWCPPGTNGMTPKISLVYNSQAGNGLMGMGWNISGLSAITRVQKDMYHDGEVAPVDFTTNDRFALDGTRLVLKNGSYGTNTSNYALETEDFSHITYFKNSTEDYFTVVKKDGTTYYYGKINTNSEDGCLRKNGGSSPVMMWALKKIMDLNGNYIEFVYDKSEGGIQNGARRIAIDEIKYTGNNAHSPYFTIRFNKTGGRVDNNEIYIAGSSITVYQILESIEILENSNVLRRYKLTYGNDGITSFLKSITEENENEFELNSTIFRYGTPNTYPPLTTHFNFEGLVPNNQLPYNADNSSADFDGDGKDEIMVLEKSYQSGIGDYVSAIKLYKYLGPLQSADFDLVKTISFPTPDYYKVRKRQGYRTNDNMFSKADFNGDGKEDIIVTRLNFYPAMQLVKLIDMDIYYGDESNLVKTLPNNVIPTYMWNGNPVSNIAIEEEDHERVVIGDFDGDTK